MNKLLIILFGLVVAAHSFSLPVSRDALSDDSTFEETPSLEDPLSTDSFLEDTSSEVLPLDDRFRSQPEEGSQGEESHQDQPEESSQTEESHQDQPEEGSQVEESHQDQPEEGSQVEESHQDQPEESSQTKESHQDQPEEGSQVEESHQDQPEEGSQVEESHQDQPAESSPVEESHSEDESAESSQTEESHQDQPEESSEAEVSQPEDEPVESSPVDESHSESQPAQDESNESNYGEDSSDQTEEKEDVEVEEKENDDDVPEDYNDDKELKVVTEGLNHFSNEFYKKTAATRTRNLVCSPVSVGALLAMTAQGARGVNEKEMYKALRYPKDSSVSKNGYKSLIESINAEKKAEVHLATAVFMNDMVEMTPEFESVTKEYFGFPIVKVPFYWTDEASDTINDWVEENTDGRIKNVVKPQDSVDAKMVLVNAVYFRGRWQSKFDHKKTEDQYFTIDSRQYKRVPTMYQKNTFNYGALPHLNADYVELPYENYGEHDEMSMFIVLPKEVTGLKKLINASETINFQELHSNPQMTPVNLYMPKFKVRSIISLQPILEKMGMRDMFKNRANFDGITKSRFVSVSKYVQKAYLEVTEEGSEDVTATGTQPNMLESPNHDQESVDMHVNHPFMYVVYHSATNTVLFQGHVKAPALK